MLGVGFFEILFDPKFIATLAAAIFTLLIGVILVLPLSIAAIRLGHEAFVLANRAAANAANGLATPEWIGRISPSRPRRCS